MSENVWDTFDTYRLRQTDLEAFLTELFPNRDFNVSVEPGGIYRFLVPRALNDAEKEDLADRRIEDDDGL